MNNELVKKKKETVNMILVICTGRVAAYSKHACCIGARLAVMPVEANRMRSLTLGAYLQSLQVIPKKVQWHFGPSLLGIT